MLTFNDYLNTNPEDSNVIFSFYLDFLGELSGKKFQYDEQLKLVGAGRKFTNTINKISYVQSETIEKYLVQITEFQNALKGFRYIENRFFLYNLLLASMKAIRLSKIQNLFQDLYSKTLELINESKEKTMYFDSLTINDFYKPDNSNKNKIKILISEAIEIIEVDSSLTEKTKKNIVDYLNIALKELDRERVNWTKFIGRIKETVIVLGALGSLVGGVSSLYKAQEKLEQTTLVIQKTSANINYNVLNETFNIHNIQQIESITQLLELPENIPKQNTPESNSDLETTINLSMTQHPKLTSPPDKSKP